MVILSKAQLSQRGSMVIEGLMAVLILGLAAGVVTHMVPTTIRRDIAGNPYTTSTSDTLARKNKSGSAAADVISSFRTWDNQLVVRNWLPAATTEKLFDQSALAFKSPSDPSADPTCNSVRVAMCDTLPQLPTGFLTWGGTKFTGIHLAQNVRSTASWALSFYNNNFNASNYCTAGIDLTPNQFANIFPDPRFKVDPAIARLNIRVSPSTGCTAAGPINVMAGDGIGFTIDVKATGTDGTFGTASLNTTYGFKDPAKGKPLFVRYDYNTNQWVDPTHTPYADAVAVFHENCDQYFEPVQYQQDHTSPKGPCASYSKSQAMADPRIARICCRNPMLPGNTSEVAFGGKIVMEGTADRPAVNFICRADADVDPANQYNNFKTCSDTAFSTQSFCLLKIYDPTVFRECVTSNFDPKSRAQWSWDINDSVPTKHTIQMAVLDMYGDVSIPQSYTFPVSNCTPTTTCGRGSCGGPSCVPVPPVPGPPVPGNPVPAPPSGPGLDCAIRNLVATGQNTWLGPQATDCGFCPSGYCSNCQSNSSDLSAPQANLVPGYTSWSDYTIDSVDTSRSRGNVSVTNCNPGGTVTFDVSGCTDSSCSAQCWITGHLAACAAGIPMVPGAPVPGPPIPQPPVPPVYGPGGGYGHGCFKDHDCVGVPQSDSARMCGTACDMEVVHCNAGTCEHAGYCPTCNPTRTPLPGPAPITLPPNPTPVVPPPDGCTVNTNCGFPVDQCNATPAMCGGLMYECKKVQDGSKQCVPAGLCRCLTPGPGPSGTQPSPYGV